MAPDALGACRSPAAGVSVSLNPLCAGPSHALVVAGLVPRASLGHRPRLSLRFPRGGAPSGRVCRCVLRRASGVSSSSLAPSFGVPGFPPVLLSPFLLAGPLCRLFPGGDPEAGQGPFLSNLVGLPLSVRAVKLGQLVRCSVAHGVHVTLWLEPPWWSGVQSGRRGGGGPGLPVVKFHKNHINGGSLNTCMGITAAFPSSPSTTPWSSVSYVALRPPPGMTEYSAATTRSTVPG